MRVSIILLVVAAACPTQGNVLSTERILKNTMQVAMPHSIESIEGVQHVGKRLLRTEGDNEDNAEERVNWKGIFFADEEAVKAAKAAKEHEKIKELAPRFSKWNDKDKEALDVFERFYYQKKWSRGKAQKMADRYEKYLNNPSAYQ
ncbi:Putative RxLR effector [Phytophthora palmivora]|uniref:RxLR effector protein n=1 Tax=Phytophthora palmivora TaxID=4796 RepID=A0A2P4WZ79_9STRA|nr:Putative RxLR effector [Phytophthora palmivora]